MILPQHSSLLGFNNNSIVMSKPAVALSKVPSIKELCELLGLQHASLKDTNTFMDSTRAWRKTYQPSSGRLATSLLHWNQASDQYDLKEMAEAFIDNKVGDKVNGEIFWSPSRSWSHGSELQFPEDRARIVELLMQLFWKQNRYAFNNSQYSHKDKVPELRNQSKEATPTQQSDLEGSIDPALTSLSWDVSGAVKGQHVFPNSKSPRETSKHARTYSILDDDDIIVQPPASSPTVSTVDTFPRDIFEVPDDPDLHTTTFLRSPKRPRLVPSTEDPPRKKKNRLPKGKEALRRTDRKRMVRNIPDTIPADQVERLIEDSDVESHDETDYFHVTAALATPESVVISLDSSDGYTAPTKQKVSTATKSILSPVGPISQQNAPIAPMTGPEKRKSYSPRSKAPLVSSEKRINDKITGSGADGAQINPSTSAKMSRPDRTMPRSPRIQRHQAQDLEPGTAPPAMPPLRSTEDESDIAPGRRSVNLTTEADGVGLPQSLAASHGSTLATEHNTSDMNKIDARDKDKQKRTPSLPIARFGSELADSDNTHPKDRSASLEGRWKNFRESPSQASTPLPRHETLPTSTEPISNETKTSTAPTLLEAKPKTQSSQLPLPAAAPKPRAKTQIPLWIITRDPLYTEERWDDGKFTGTPLATFLEGIAEALQRSAAHIEKIKLTLQTPMSHTKITVCRDAEDSWVEAKATFVEKLKEARKLARGDMTGCKILVEPFWEKGEEANGGLDDEEAEFEF